MHSAVYCLRRRAHLSVSSSLKLSVWWGQGHHVGWHTHVSALGVCSLHIYTNTQMHLDRDHMFKSADVSVCLCSWGWYASGTTVCLLDFYLVVLTFSVALKVLSFCYLSGHWYWCQGDMHQKFNSLLDPSGPALDSEYDLEMQIWWLSVNELAETYLERDPLALKHNQIFC